MSGLPTRAQCKLDVRLLELVALTCVVAGLLFGAAWVVKMWGEFNWLAEIHPLVVIVIASIIAGLWFALLSVPLWLPFWVASALITRGLRLDEPYATMIGAAVSVISPIILITQTPIYEAAGISTFISPRPYDFAVLLIVASQIAALIVFRKSGSRPVATRAVSQ